MKPVFECEIPGRVVPKKNSRRLAQVQGRLRSFPSKQFLAWERSAQFHVKQTLIGRHSILTGELMAEYVFHFKNRQNESDVSNCIEGPQDVLQSVGVIKNDKQIVELTARKVFDGTEKTVIRLFEMPQITANREN